MSDSEGKIQTHDVKNWSNHCRPENNKNKITDFFAWNEGNLQRKPSITQDERRHGHVRSII